jgi:predicted nuclease of predicted toxin-antitoxin system
VKLLLDEMISARIAERLRADGHDVRAIDESPGLRGLSDPDVFAHAQQEERAIVTYNREDFRALDREYTSRQHEHHGIVILHPRRFPQGQQPIASLSNFVNAAPLYPSFIH